MSGKKTSKKDKRKYKALIIGAGRIAAFFDNPHSREIITHAHAYKKHAKIAVLGFLDINKKAADRAAEIWGGVSVGDMVAAAKFKPDIVSICVPDSHHYQILKKVIKLGPKVVICEKPLTDSIDHSCRILKIYRAAGIPVIINYSRRFDLTVQQVKDDIRSGKYGKVLCGRAIYGKGILHNGSHIIDLCHYLFGPVTGLQSEYCFSDYNQKNDKNVAAFLKFKNCPQFHLAAGDERKFSIFEFDIFLEKRRYTFFDSGICYLSTQNVDSDPLYPGYRCLGKAYVGKTRIGIAAMQLVNNAIEVIEHQEKPVCDMADAYNAQKICFSLLKNLK